MCVHVSVPSCWSELSGSPTRHGAFSTSLPPCPVVSWPAFRLPIYPAQRAWTTANKPFLQQLRKVQTKTSCFSSSETPTIARNQKDYKIRGGVFACCSRRTWPPCFSAESQMVRCRPFFLSGAPKPEIECVFGFTVTLFKHRHRDSSPFHSKLNCIYCSFTLKLSFKHFHGRIKFTSW